MAIGFNGLLKLDSPHSRDRLYGRGYPPCAIGAALKGRWLAVHFAPFNLLAGTGNKEGTVLTGWTMQFSTECLVIVLPNDLAEFRTATLVGIGSHNPGMGTIWTEAQ